REEGQNLGRPCSFLRDTGPKGDLAAAWGGPGIVLPPKKGTYRHWISVDCRFYKEFLHHYGAKIGPPAGILDGYTEDDRGRVAGFVSVYRDDAGGGVAAQDRRARLSVEDATPLYAHGGRSIPPIDAVFRLGSPAVQAWLKANKWKPEWGYSDNLKDKKPAQYYVRSYQELCPLYSGSAHAVLGGWHFPWPDGDWAELVERPLLLWTFEDSEPWVEVWGDGKRFEVKQRIT